MHRKPRKLMSVTVIALSASFFFGAAFAAEKAPTK
ncbi:MAG: hypothetical protein HW419_2316, partial [Deltaproteobacteria bacterium]|nr:hypothetical protein [Deltaproteobacteria bacterium]